jgi:hypothetical protein
MPNLGGFESAIYLRQDVIADALLRHLGDPASKVSDDPPRQISFPSEGVDPHVKLWWDKPTVEIQDEDTAIVSVALAGGMRQVSQASEPGRIASLHGTLKAPARITTSNPSGIACLQLNVESLDLRGLRVQYADSYPLPLVGIGGVAEAPQEAIAHALAADALTSMQVMPRLLDLMTALAQFPLSYGADVLTGVAEVPTAQTRVFTARAGKVAAIGVRRPSAEDIGGAHSTQLGNLLEAHTQSNMAIAVTSGWLSARLANLVADGSIEKRLLDASGKDFASIEPLSVSLHRGHVQFMGQVVHEGSQAALNVDLRCTRAADGRLLSLAVDTLRFDAQDGVGTAPRGEASELTRDGQGTLDDMKSALAPLQVAYWSAVVAKLLGVPFKDNAIELALRATLPGGHVAPESPIKIDVPIDTLELDDSVLVLYCSVPAAPAFEPQKPDRQPQVSVVQHTIPHQEAPHQPVVATVDVQVNAESYQPYDFAWKSDSRLFSLIVGMTPTALRPLITPWLARMLPAHVLPRHQSQLALTGLPSGIDGDPEKMSAAQVAVIDAFGQVATAESAVLAHPSPLTPRQTLQRKALRVTSAASAVVVPLAALAATAVVLRGIIPPPVEASGFLAMPLVPQICTSSTTLLPPSAVALDNTKGKTSVAWQAMTEGTVLGTQELWAVFSNGNQMESGKVAAGATEAVTVQPAADVCARAIRAGGRQVYYVSIHYANGQLIRVSETVELFLVGVHVAVSPTAPTSQTGLLTLGQSCNQFNRSNPVQPFDIVLDNSKSTMTGNYEVIVIDMAPPPPGLLARAPSSSPVYWAQADVPRGILPPKQSVVITITPLSTLCQGMTPRLLSRDFHIFVLYGGSLVTITDSIASQSPG